MAHICLESKPENQNSFTQRYTLTFWEIFQFLGKSSIFSKKFNFWENLQFLVKSLIFGKSSFFGRNFNFWENVKFLEKNPKHLPSVTP